MKKNVETLIKLNDLHLETPEQLGEYYKKIRTFQLRHRDGPTPSPLLTEDPNDTAFLFGSECSDVLCTKSLIMLKTEATEKIASILGSEIVKPDVSPSEFDAMLDTIPNETLFEALKKLAISLKRDPEMLEIHVEIAGGPHK